MTNLFQQLHNLFATTQNQFLSGGLALGIIGSIGYWLKSLPGKLWAWFLFHCTVKLEVISTDQAYQWLLVWMEAQPYTNKARRIALRDVKMRNAANKSAIVPARGDHWFFYRGVPIWLNRGNDATGAPSGGGGMSSQAAAMMPKETLSIRTIGRKRNRINQIINEAKLLYEQLTLNKLVVRYRRWGEWETRFKHKRSIDSVFLDTKADIVSDMRRFLTSEEWYAKMGLPYRRGYLFHGVAGSGKSSLAEALASELDLPVYVLNLASVDDTQLESTFAEIASDEPIMLLLEDIDTVAPNRDTEAIAKAGIPGIAPRLRLGTLLNVLDGLTATDKIILVMTTNFFDKIDPALKRRGRVDMAVQFDYATNSQIDQAAHRFLGTPTYEQLSTIAAWPRPITMCDVQENLRQMVWERAAIAEAAEDKAA